MLLASVIGNIIATRKTDSLTGIKLLVLQTADGKKLVAGDALGAGIGDEVIVAAGSVAQYALPGEKLPVDAVVVGIVDYQDKSV